MPQQVRLSYTTRCGAGSAATVDLDILSCRGAAEPDDFEIFPDVRHEFLNGSLAEQIAGGRRNIELVLAVIDSALNRRKLVDFWLDPDRSLVCLAVAPGQASKSGSASGTLNGNYKYKISAVDAIGESACGTISAIIALAVEGCPLIWTASANARQYKIYRTIDPYTVWNLVGYSSTNAYTDTGTTFIAAVTPPSSATTISVSRGEFSLVSEWAGGTELSRKYSLLLREASINDEFPI